jgi:cellulose synthase/poly-beta-1,6-N-acetylglucosamine synthase-like glycosyltransferase
LDADTIPHATWLRELAAPLTDEKIGAATGNRWYMPAGAGVGSIVRYTWNAAAIVQMFWYEIAWGGTLALKLKVIREANLLERWTHAFCEDTMLYRELRKQQKRVAFVPSLMMVNRESCDLPGFLRWMRRQLLTARLYHPRWFAVAGHCLGTFLLILLALVLAGNAALHQQWDALAWVLGGLACYFVSMVSLLPPMEWAVRRIVRERGEEHRWLTWGKVAMFLLTVPFVQAIYPLTLLSAMFLRRVSWRGVEYEVSRTGTVRMLAYQPFVAEPHHGEHSL